MTFTPSLYSLPPSPWRGKYDQYPGVIGSGNARCSISEGREEGEGRGSDSENWHGSHNCNHLIDSFQVDFYKPSLTQRRDGVIQSSTAFIVQRFICIFGHYKHQKRYFITCVEFLLKLLKSLIFMISSLDIINRILQNKNSSENSILKKWKKGIWYWWILSVTLFHWKRLYPLQHIPPLKWLHWAAFENVKITIWNIELTTISCYFLFIFLWKPLK